MIPITDARISRVEGPLVEENFGTASGFLGRIMCLLGVNLMSKSETIRQPIKLQKARQRGKTISVQLFSLKHDLITTRSICAQI